MSESRCKDLYNGLDINTLGRKINCDSPDYRDALFIANSYYGFSCVKEDNAGSAYELRLTECLVGCNATHGTILSEAQVVEISSYTRYIKPNNKLMWKVCRDVVSQWTALKEDERILPLTIEWDLLLEKYPNGAFDIYPHLSAAHATTRITFWPVNFGRSASQPPWENVGQPATGMSCSILTNRNATLIVHGAALYECLPNDRKPSFFGCLLGPAGSHKGESLQRSVAVISEYNLNKLRRLYAYVAFKSTARPMEKNIGEMNERQLCARLSIDMFAQDTMNDDAAPFYLLPYYKEITYEYVRFSPSLLSPATLSTDGRG